MADRDNIGVEYADKDDLSLEAGDSIKLIFPPTDTLVFAEPPKMVCATHGVHDRLAISFTIIGGKTEREVVVCPNCCADALEKAFPVTPEPLKET